MEVVVRHGSILEVTADAVVNPANSLGQMGGGIAGVLRRSGGKAIEAEAVRAAPIAVGKAVSTGAGKLPFKYVIHAPTMERPAQRIEPEAVYRATLAALQEADRLGVESLAMPGMGTGVGGVPAFSAAKQMTNAIRDTSADRLSMLFLVDVSLELVDAWNQAISGNDPLLR